MAAKYLLIPVLLLALSVTYASFSDTLFIGTANTPNTVTTTDMEWELVPDTFYYGDGRLQGSFNPMSPNIVNENLAEVNCTPSDTSNGPTTIECTVTNAYPGYTFYIDFKIKNTGNLPSKIRKVEVQYDNANIANTLRVAYALSYNRNGGSYNENPFTSAYVADLTLEQFAEEVNTTLQGIVFQKNGWIKFGHEDGNTIYFYFPPDSNPPQGETLHFNITFVFGQFNE